MTRTAIQTKAPTPRGALSEQLVFRVSKATAKRIDAYQREKGLESRADALRAALRTVGL